MNNPRRHHSHKSINSVLRQSPTFSVPLHNYCGGTKQYRFSIEHRGAKQSVPFPPLVFRTRHLDVVWSGTRSASNVRVVSILTSSTSFASAAAPPPPSHALLFSFFWAYK